VPPRVEYALTPLGASLSGPIKLLDQWVERNLRGCRRGAARVRPARRLRRHPRRAAALLPRRILLCCRHGTDAARGHRRPAGAHPTLRHARSGRSAHRLRGFLDAFTWVGHGHVFANAMTGNVVLLGVFATAGNWPQAWRHLPPIIAFICGVLTARLIGRGSPRPCCAIRDWPACWWRCFFSAAPPGWPASFPDLPLVLACPSSRAAELQLSRVGDRAYNSVMTTGNLRNFAHGLYLLFQAEQRHAGLQQAKDLRGDLPPLPGSAPLPAAASTPAARQPRPADSSLLLALTLLRIYHGCAARILSRTAGNPG